ncbi:MAG: hypothetical protein CMI02_07525 [Oceanospirillaceae bacterium]|nr:hypothetical protein [Oceanospirillaceae bacterium]MBT11868.1 hypothetical protein [Oceanospirillaceae bacterium]|tara:strand:+ start:20820 stop:21551 length:732 start_codon:yes stop_codon:yes gene_type:complete
MMNKLCVLLTAVLALAPCHADTVTVAVGLALPPYVLADENRGAELDVVREALAVKGHTLKPVYVPFRKVVPLVVDGEVDASMTLNEDSGAASLFYSGVHMVYQNVAVSLTDRNIDVSSVEDLGKYWVLGFQDASKYLGDEYARMAEENPRYGETSRQKSQVSMLFKERVDVVVSDKNIFNWYRRQQKGANVRRAVTQFALFPPTNYKVAFNKEALRNDFDAGLEQLKTSGRYAEILEYYFRES